MLKYIIIYSLLHHQLAVKPTPTPTPSPAVEVWTQDVNGKLMPMKGSK